MTDITKIFIGYDHRQAVSYHTLAHSIMTRASQPVSITPLILNQLPVRRTGLTPFTYSRFLLPWLCKWQGRALFLDADMLCLGDIAELFGYLGSHDAIAVRTDCAKFERAAVMLFNCGHFAHRQLIPSWIEAMPSAHKISWVQEDQIASIPAEWAHIVLYDEPREDAKLVHFTGGVPEFPEVVGAEYGQEWLAEKRAMSGVTSNWFEMMGPSVHYEKVRDAYEANRARGGDQPANPPWPHKRPGEEDAA